MWRRSLSLVSYRTFCSSSSIENPSLYSFLQPSLFSIKPTSPLPNPPSTSDASPKQLSADAKASLEAAIHRSLSTHDTDEAWKSFKSLTGVSSFPNKERDAGQGLQFGEDIYNEVVQGFLKSGSDKDLAGFVIQSQLIQDRSIMAERSIAFGIMNACVNLGMLDKAHGILDEMNSRGANVSLGVYLPILDAYCKEQRTAEAAEMVADINRSELQLDTSCYDALIEASMTSQDFQSAFSLFRDLRDARTSDLKGSYLTIITGLTENNRPELMAAFLDEVVGDPRIEVGTHDWNSTIHSFCKAGRLEDARRTFRRMIFLQFEPNGQTYLSLINGYVSAGKYFSVLLLWNEVRKHASTDGGKGFVLDQSLIDAFLYAMVKGGFFDAVMQVVEKSQELRIFVDKWRYKQAFMEHHKKLKIAKLRRRNYRKVESLIAFKNWVGLNA
ncbi:hypothetical protein V2J09_015330 [Rumex salicifolius]